ncbi:MAG: hypothetical protein PHQ74_07980 [Crocinitomicaceae bacterium]|nr:hypothetical protein [Crocinitomicaceae bacterium]
MKTTCELSKPIKASFIMGYKVEIDSCDNTSSNDYSILEDSDTCRGGLITFRSTTCIYDSLRWIVGNHPDQFTTKEFSLSFNAQFAGMSIPITLIAKRSPNTICYPNDDGIDTLVRYLYVKPFDSAHIYAGKFLGYNVEDGASDLFEIELTSSSNFNAVTFINLPRGANPPFGFGSLYNSQQAYKRFYFCRSFDFGGHGLNNIIGVVKYNSNYDSVRIEYSYSIDPEKPNRGSNSIKKTFLGTRI